MIIKISKFPKILFVVVVVNYHELIKSNKLVRVKYKSQLLMISSSYIKQINFLVNEISILNIVFLLNPFIKLSYL